MPAPQKAGRARGLSIYYNRTQTKSRAPEGEAMPVEAVFVRINIPRLRRGYFICVQSPMILASAPRRASTVCQPREICYLLPVNGSGNFPSSIVLLLCPHLTGVGYILLSFSLSFLPYPLSILDTKIPGSCTCIPILGTFHRSSDCSSLFDIP